MYSYGRCPTPRPPSAHTWTFRSLVGGPYRLPARRKSQFESRWNKSFAEFSEKFGEGYLEYEVYGLVRRASSIFHVQHLDAIYRDLTIPHEGNAFNPQAAVYRFALTGREICHRDRPARFKIRSMENRS
jgi:hypothetical protein